MGKEVAPPWNEPVTLHLQVALTSKKGGEPGFPVPVRAFPPVGQHAAGCPDLQDGGGDKMGL